MVSQVFMEGSYPIEHLYKLAVTCNIETYLSSSERNEKTFAFLRFSELHQEERSLCI